MHVESLGKPRDVNNRSQSLVDREGNPFKLNGISRSSLGSVHFRLKGYWNEFIILIQISIDHSVSKLWRS